MSDAQGPSVTPKNGDAWGDAISEERQEQLKVLADQQREWIAQPQATRGDSVFQGIWLKGADVFWLVSYATAVSRDDAATTLHPPLLALIKVNSFRFQYVPNGTGQTVIQAIPPALHLEGAFLHGVRLERANIREAHLEKVILIEAHLEGANLQGAHLEGANLAGAHLEGANLAGAHLKGAHLVGAHLEGANLSGAFVEGANLSLACFSMATTLEGVTLGSSEHGYVRVADVRWDGVNLAVVKWTQRDTGNRHRRLKAIVLGDEWKARQVNDENGKPKNAEVRLHDFEAAVRANRQLATALRNQGLNEDADRFAYRAQILQREVFRQERHWGPSLFSGVLDMLAGHGYRPERSLVAYLIAIFGFGIAYYAIGLEPV